MRTIETENRVCDLCGGNDVEEIWSYQIKQKTKNSISLWNVRNVICRFCGFGFVSPCPTQESLGEHYRDSFELSNSLKPDYSIEKRIHLIKKYAGTSGQSSYLEVGSNNCPKFTDSLKRIVRNISTLEINESCESSYNDVKNIPEKSADIIAAYFVFEHVPNPIELLGSYRNILSDNGVLIIEVPNLLIYPRDPAGLDLCEHVNHFSPYTLARIAENCGYEMIESSQSHCSRPFGFVSVFRKSESREVAAKKNKVEFLIGKTCMLEGAQMLKNLTIKQEKARRKIMELNIAGKTVIVWAANWYCMRLIEGFELPQTAVIVDSDARKKDYFPGITVYEPSKVLEKIRLAEFLIINTPFYASEIKDWIKENTGKVFSEENLMIMDYY